MTSDSRQGGVPAGYRLVQTDHIVGDVGWRWGRKRAIRLAGRMNGMNAGGRDLLTHRYAVRHLGFGRWRVIALQNRVVADLAGDADGSAYLEE